LADRSYGENLRHFFARHSDAQLREFLAGYLGDAVARDLASGVVPHGLEG
jgi:hypothetical protein